MQNHSDSPATIRDEALQRRVDAWARIIDQAPLFEALLENGTALGHAQADLARCLFLGQNLRARDWTPEQRERTRIVDAAYAKLRLAFHDGRMAADLPQVAATDPVRAMARAGASAFTVLAAIAAKPSPREPVRQVSHS
jgi:hypothetical protein